MAQPRRPERSAAATYGRSFGGGYNLRTFSERLHLPDVLPGSGAAASYGNLIHCKQIPSYTDTPAICIIRQHITPSTPSDEFVHRAGAAEEQAILTGDGSHKPIGLLHATLGAQTGVTAASSTAITADELIDMQHSLKSGYRRKACWIMNDATISAIRKLKDGQRISAEFPLILKRVKMTNNRRLNRSDWRFSLWSPITMKTVITRTSEFSPYAKIRTSKFSPYK